MKKIICLSAAASLIAALAIGAGAAGEEKIVLKSSDDTLAVGDTLTVTIAVENFENFNTAMFYDVEYDENYLQWTGGSWLLEGGTLSDYVRDSKVTDNGEQGRSGVYYSDDSELSGTINIATMEFTVLQESETAQSIGCSVIVKNDETEVVSGSAETEVTLGEEKTPVNISGANMLLGNDLTMNFWISKSVLDGTDYYAVVTKNYADGRDPVERTFQFVEWEDYNSSYYRVNFAGIAAKEMSDTINVQIYNGNGTPAGELWTDSIALYAQRGYKGWNDEQKTWAVDMLNYGAAAQNIFGYATDNLANAGLTAEQQAYATTEITLTNSLVKGNNYFASTLVMESNLCLTVYFKNLTTDMYAKVSFTDHYGKLVETEVSGADFRANSGYLGVAIENMVAADARCPITVTVYNADGSVYGTATDSIESYAARITKNPEQYQEVMKFADSCYNILH